MERAVIPKPYKRLYDDKRKKRQLFVSITTWRGVSVGAKHWYAKVYEDENPIVYEGRLISYSDDDECQGKEFGGMFETNFDSFDAALEWVIDTIKEHFPNHKPWDCSGGLLTLAQLKKALKDE